MSRALQETRLLEDVLSAWPHFGLTRHQCRIMLEAHEGALIDRGGKTARPRGALASHSLLAIAQPQGFHALRVPGTQHRITSAHAGQNSLPSFLKNTWPFKIGLWYIRMYRLVTSHPNRQTAPGLPSSRRPSPARRSERAQDITSSSEALVQVCLTFLVRRRGPQGMITS